MINLYNCMKDHRYYQNPERIYKHSLYTHNHTLKQMADFNKSIDLPQKQIYHNEPSFYPKLNSFISNTQNQNRESPQFRDQDYSHRYGLPRTYSLKMQSDPAFIQLNKSQIIQSKKQEFMSIPPLKFVGTEMQGKGFSKINSARQMVATKQEPVKPEQYYDGWKSQKEADSPTFSPTYPSKGSIQWSIKKKKSKKSDDFGSNKKGFSGDKFFDVVPVEEIKPVNTVITVNKTVDIVGKDSSSKIRRLSNNQYLKTTNNPTIPTTTPSPNMPSPTSQSNPSPKTESKLLKRGLSYTALSTKDLKPNLGSPFSGSECNQSSKVKYFQMPTQPDTPSSDKKLKFKQPSKKDFLIGKSLGKGRFGDVLIAKHKEIGFICAMKVMSKKTIMEEDFVNQFCRQVTIQMYLKHCNIAALYGVFDDHENVYLLMELCLGGPLYKLMKQVRPMPEQDAVSIIKQICLGTEYLHRENIIHRDLKPQNIIMHQNLVKICDFGWAVYSKDNMRDTFCGTPLFLSPQMLKGENYCEKIDNWAIGMISYEMIVGRPAFKIQTQKQLQKILVQDIQFPEYYNISDLAKEFILKLLDRDQNKRMEIQEALSHPFLAQN